jgi:hypothetical protein
MRDRLKRWVIVIVALLGMYGLLDNFVSKVVKEHPALWTLTIIAALSLAVAIDRLILWLYIRYWPSQLKSSVSPSILEHGDR